MNRALRRLSVAVLVMFVALLVNTNYLQVVRAQDLRNNPQNSRILLEEYSRERGPILVGGRPVARSVETDDTLRYLRRYDSPQGYAHLTGFYSFVYGASGIERSENGVLAGTDDSLFVRRVVDLVTGAKPRGGSVALTIDPAAQRAAIDGLGGRKGAVVALDPSTGAILAMYSNPSYDPNVLSSHDGKKIRAAYEALDKDPDKPLLNRALRETYPPGSTFKLVTAAAALESGRYNPTSKVTNVPALDLPLTTTSLPNFDNRPCNPGGSSATLTDALRRSCNASFGEVGLAIGGDALRAQAEKFGFDSSVDVPIRSAVSAFPDELNAPQTAQSAIGQFSVRATPLQMAMVVAAIANRGQLMKPYLVGEVRAPDLSLISVTEPEVVRDAVSPGTASALTSMMVQVVENGTGSNGRIPGITVAGKTGTAQQGGDRPPHAWFVSFGPVPDAKVAVAVIIESGGGVAEVSGNKLAAPVARAVMEAVLR